LENNDSSDVAPRSFESEFPQASPNSQTMTCQNSRCGRVFDRPLELIDLARPSDKSSYVCPYCLSKFEPIQPEQETVTKPFAGEKLQDVVEQKEGKCPHFFGYLSGRPKNTPIPDFCLTCQQMMKCLLG